MQRYNFNTLVRYSTIAACHMEPAELSKVKATLLQFARTS